MFVRHQLVNHFFLFPLFFALKYTFFVILKGNIKKSCLQKRLTVLLTKECSPYKEQISHDDLLDALRLSLGYTIN